MFQKFWKEKGYILSVGGIVIAIGTLFLSISPADNDPARSYLINIQFFSLLIITVAIVAIFRALLVFMYKYGKKDNEKYGLNYLGGIALCLTFIALWFVLYLIGYIVSRYELGFINFLESMLPVLLMIFAILILYGFSRVEHKFSKWGGLLVFDLIWSTLIATEGIFYIGYLHISPNWIIWARILLISFFIILIIGYIVSLIPKKSKVKKQS